MAFSQPTQTLCFSDNLTHAACRPTKQSSSQRRLPQHCRPHPGSPGTDRPALDRFFLFFSRVHTISLSVFLPPWHLRRTHTACSSAHPNPRHLCVPLPLSDTPQKPRNTSGNPVGSAIGTIDSLPTVHCCPARHTHAVAARGPCWLAAAGSRRGSGGVVGLRTRAGSRADPVDLPAWVVTQFTLRVSSIPSCAIPGSQTSHPGRTLPLDWGPEAPVGLAVDSSHARRT